MLCLLITAVAGMISTSVLIGCLVIVRSHARKRTGILHVFKSILNVNDFKTLKGIAVVVINVHTCLGCPEEAVTQVYGCLSNLVGKDGEIKVLAGDDAEDFYKKCLDGSFDITVHCVQTIMTQCTGTEQEKALKNTLDPVVMKWAFDTACAKKDHYLQTAPCISQYKDRIHACCKSIQRQFIAAKDEAYTLDKYMELMCSFINGVTGCTEAPIRRYCDPATAETVVDFLSGITPVTCSPYRNNGSSFTQPQPFLITMVLLIGLCSVLQLMGNS